MKKVLAFLAALVLMAQVQPAYAADAYNAEAQGLPGDGGIFLIAEEGNFMPISTFVASETKSNSTDQWVCDGADDPACSSSKAAVVQANYLLPVCQKISEDNCIVSLEIAQQGKNFEVATFLRNTTGLSFPAEPSSGYPGGSTTSLWEVKDNPSASGTLTYSVSAKGIAARNGSNKKFETSAFSAVVVPYREQAGGWKDTKQVTGTQGDIHGDRKRFVGIEGGDQACAWSENGKCGVPQDFTEGTRVRLTVRISNAIGGWFKGRLKDPLISVSKASKSNNEITVEAEPVSVARMSYKVQGASNLTAQDRDIFKSLGAWGGKDNFMTWSPAWESRTFSYVDYFRPKVKDTASGVTTFWNFSTSDLNGNGNQCLADKSKVLGLVTTNAMVYDGGVPQFSGGFLNYKVAGLHYAPDGEDLNLGVYDLVMRSETARCLYGWGKAPLSATVSVVNDKGGKTVATTVVKETKDGWLKMAAYGFTFSKKTIKVKITKKKK